MCLIYIFTEVNSVAALSVCAVHGRQHILWTIFILTWCDARGVSFFTVMTISSHEEVFLSRLVILYTNNKLFVFVYVLNVFFVFGVRCWKLLVSIMLNEAFWGWFMCVYDKRLHHFAKTRARRSRARIRSMVSWCVVCDIRARNLNMEFVFGAKEVYSRLTNDANQMYTI